MMKKAQKAIWKVSMYKTEGAAESAAIYDEEHQDKCTESSERMWIFWIFCK